MRKGLFEYLYFCEPKLEALVCEVCRSDWDVIREKKVVVKSLKDSAASDMHSGA